jgi:hypothetical protein
MIPLISTLCKGPLGVAQLPRFWWKNILHHTGLLDPAYPHCSGGLDLFVLQTLKLDREKTLEYLRRERPAYLRFEDWVLDQCGGSLHQPTIERWNKTLEQRTHVAPDKIRETYTDIGLDENATIASAVLLNCLQDWQLFHRSDLTGKNSNLKVPIAPLISSTDQGPLGICQLPRTWLKTCLKARGLLHPDYPDCAEGSLDQRGLRTLGVDQGKALSYLREKIPTYLEFEDWVRRETGGRIDKEAVEEFNRLLTERQHRPAKIEEIHALLGRPKTWTSGVLLNHLEDWHYAHAAVMS